jgi:hypothetical protein
MNTAPDQPHAAHRRSRSWLDGLLGLSAAALFVIAMVQVATTAAFQPIAKAASGERAGMISTVGEYTLMTADIGNEDAMLLLDGRAEEILVYRADSQQVMQVAQKLNLPRTFVEARTRAGVKPAAPDTRDRDAREPRTNPPR